MHAQRALPGEIHPPARLADARRPDPRLRTIASLALEDLIHPRGKPVGVLNSPAPSGRGYSGAKAWESKSCQSCSSCQRKQEQNSPGLSEAGYNADWVTVEP